LSAYRQILDAPDDLGITHAKILSAMGLIQRLQGADKAALKSFHLATAKSAKHGVAMGNMRLVAETSQLIRMGHIRRARKLLGQRLAHRSDEFVDHLGTARLLVEWAKCDLASNNPTSAAPYLQNAWAWLDALVESYSAHEDSLREALGIHLAYADWWLTEGKRRKLAREGDSELIAFNYAIEKCGCASLVRVSALGTISN
jgi:hypothetical protein